MPHHDLQSCQLDRLNHRYLCAATAAFFNTIGPNAKSRCFAQCPSSRAKRKTSARTGYFAFCCGFWTPATMKDPRAQLAGVQKAPRHEVAGSWAPAKQRALVCTMAHRADNVTNREPLQ